MTCGGEAVFVEAAARLHFGVLDLRGSLGRSFGGIGASAPAPSVLVSAQAADTVTAEGDDATRALEYARRFLSHHGIVGGARLRVHRAIPSHAGLGSGTQLALATARALADLHGVATDVPALARAVGRAKRSAIGMWTFAGGGLVLEGGRRAGQDGYGPLLARLPIPASWHCVVAVPESAPGVSGEAETRALAGLPVPAQRDVERVSHLVVMGLLPSLAEQDLPGFGAALGEIQRITGGWFAPAQGGVFAAGPTAALVARLRDWGAVGVGQSSWGPAVYGIVDGEAASAALAARVRAVIDRGLVFEGPFRRTGARCWRAPIDSVMG